MKTCLCISKLSSLLLLLAFLNGCLLIPHRVTVSASIVGRVHRNGQPVEDATVYVAVRAERCYEGSLFMHTDSDGKFNFERRREIKYILVMDPAYSLRVCIADGDRRYVGWSEGGFGGPADMTLDCDLENDPLKQNRRGGTGVCNDNSQYKTKPKKN